jgi:hypothetical protein
VSGARAKREAVRRGEGDAFVSRDVCMQHGGTCGSRRVVFYSRRFSEKLKTTAPLVRIIMLRGWNTIDTE